ncbi:MAG: hypothetical protein KDD50_01175 [Bdellovibrionales bacterium]|nr:hypothetical protein [Bdellovibrionales bacterium]
MKRTGFILVLLFFIIESVGNATTTRVGNGDNGSDLEGFERVQSGPLINAQKKAVKLLNGLNVGAIRGLGSLIPEVENTKIYITKKDVSDLELKSLGGFETDMRGYVYARTFARPHAATRFFPISKSLTEDQLVALHIHEGLHRALHEKIREDEKIVSDITLSITGPEATVDQITSVCNKYVPSYENSSLAIQYYLEEDQIERSAFSVESRIFSDNDSGTPTSAYVLNSRLYPFGGSMTGVGLGLKFSYLQNSDGKNEIGPLSISLVGKLNTPTRFRILWFAEGTFHSGEPEGQSTFVPRDTKRLGLKMFTLKTDELVLSNSIQYTMGSEVKDETFSIPINYKYGDILSARMDLKGRVTQNIGVGGFLEYSLADELIVTSGSSSRIVNKRERIVTVGPEIGWLGSRHSFIIFSTFLLNADENFNLSRFGDILYYGSGKQNIGVKFNYNW